MWQQRGNVGWSRISVLPRSKRGEKQQRGANEFHGADAESGLSEHAEPHPASEAFVAVGQAAALPSKLDFNGTTQDGIGRLRSFAISQPDGELNVVMFVATGDQSAALAVKIAPDRFG